MKILLLIVFIGLGVSPAARADESTELNAMLNYFSAGCPTQGEWTKAAIGSAKALIDVLKTLKDDPDCKTLSGAMGTLGLLDNKLNEIQLDPNEIQYAGLNKQQQDILLQLSITSDPTAQADLKSQLRLVQGDLSKYSGFVDGYNHYRSRVRTAATYQQLVASTNALLMQANANTMCLTKNPQVLSGIASLAGSVGAVAMTGGASLGLAAGVELLGAIVEHARVHKITKKINQVASTIALSAYQCVLESLSNQYCSADDALRVIKLKSESLTSAHLKGNPILIGTYLLERDIPIVMQWLERVRSGTDPTNQASADRQATVLEAEKAVRQARPIGLGIYAENKVLYDAWEAEADPQKKSKQQWLVVRSTITAMISRLTSSTVFPGLPSPPNPLLNVYDQTYAPYYLMGIAREHAPRSSTGGILPFEQFDPFSQLTGYVPNLAIVREKLLAWVADAQDRVNRELGIVLQPDPLELINEAAIQNIYGRTPYGSIQKVLEFLKAQKPGSFVVGSYERLYADTISRLEAIESAIRAVVDNPKSDPTKAMDQLSEIYKAASLDYGTVVLSGRLEEAIRISLNEKLTTSKPGTDFETASQLVAANDLIEYLKQYSGNSDLNLISRDVENSELAVSDVLQNFVDLFGPGITTWMYQLNSDSQVTVNLQADKSRKALAEICLKLLAIPEWPASIPQDLCTGISLDSLFKGGPRSVTISEETYNLPLEKRACSYRNYIRMNKIHQDYLERRSAQELGY